MAEVIGSGLASFAPRGLLPSPGLVRLDPYQGCNFIIEIEGLHVGGFSSCSGLQVETEVHEYREGGVNDYVHRFAGPAKHPSLVLKHGMSPLDGLWQWHQDVVTGAFKRRNGTIYLLNRQRLPVAWWNFKKALPVKWSGPELDAQTGAVAFETVEIAHHGLSRPRLATTVSGIAGELMTSFGVGGFF